MKLKVLYAMLMHVYTHRRVYFGIIYVEGYIDTVSMSMYEPLIQMNATGKISYNKL